MDWGPFAWFPASGLGIIGAIIVSIVILILGLAVSFLPTIIAIVRHHRNTLGVFLLNFFLGWTFLGWVAALIWAVVK
jgi:hypothetical protein